MAFRQRGFPEIEARDERLAAIMAAKSKVWLLFMLGSQAIRGESQLSAHFISLSGASRSPYAIKPPRCCACVMRGVPRISVAEIVLD